MTDPKQPKAFVGKKDGKLHTHYRRHVANQRQVDIGIWKKSFDTRFGRKPTVDECNIFKSGFNMGYKEGRTRTTSLLTSKESDK